MNHLEAGSAEMNSDDVKAQWQKPEVSKFIAAGAEGGDSFSGDGGSSLS